MENATLNGEILLVARHTRGVTQEQVGDAAGITQGLVSKAEKGVAPLDPTVVEAIAGFLGYPVRLFYEPGRIREVGSPCLYHRKRKTLPAKILDKIDSRMLMRNLNVSKLLSGLDLDGDRIFHTMDPDEYGGSPVEVARALRAAWRIPDGPILNLTALIESAGGIVLKDDFGTRKLFGMSCWTTRGRPLFFLNAAMPTADLRWTVAHELAHLTMHAGPPAEDPEEEADAFAGEFLAPQAMFQRDARRLVFSRLPNLKAYWRISMKAIIKRAEAIGAIDRAAAIRLYKQHSARGYNTAEPYPVPDEPPTLIDEAIRVHLRDHGYTHRELAEAIALTSEEFARTFLAEELHPANVIKLFGDPSQPASV